MAVAAPMAVRVATAVPEGPVRQCSARAARVGAAAPVVRAVTAAAGAAAHPSVCCGSRMRL
jgi:hypothetical protein